MNSFRFIERAIAFEVERQTQVVDAGGTIVQETRGWDEPRNVTVSQRRKEQADDYRYFPEPDLLPIALTPEFVEGIRLKLPELPTSRRARLQGVGLTPQESQLLTSTRQRSDFLDAVTSLGVAPKAAANWLLGDIARLEREVGKPQAGLQPTQVVELVGLVEQGKITMSAAKSALPAMVQSGESPAAIVTRLGLLLSGDQDELKSLVDAVLAANVKSVEDVRKGKEKAISFLLGQVMRQSRGRFDPKSAEDVIRHAIHEGD